MSNMPLDARSLLELADSLKNAGNVIIFNDSALRTQIKTLSTFVKEALQFSEAKDTIWEDDASTFIRSLEKIEIDNQNARFNRANGHSPVPVKLANASGDREIPALSFPQDKYQAAALDQKLNEMESGFGEEMDEAALARHFGETGTKEVTKDRLKKPLSKMTTIKEIEDYEAEQDNSNDIYKIAARIKNLARGNAGSNLGQQQEMLCNSFCHVVKSFYDFAETIPDKELKSKLIALTRAQEGIPANIISAALAGVKEAKKK